MKIRNCLRACDSEVLKIYRAEEIAQLIKCLAHSMSPEFNPYHPPKRQVQRICLVLVILGRQRQEDAWDSKASQSN